MIRVFIIVFTIGLTSLIQPRENFKMYVLKDRYNVDTRAYMEAHDNIYDIKLLGGYMIDPHKKGVIDLKSTERYLTKIFPNKFENGTLCVDLENQLYRNLRDHDKNHPLNKKAVKEFRRLISFIKDKRPNVKVGIYGLPFNVYYPHQNSRNQDNKFDPILELTDILFPSLYVFYPDEQKGTRGNDRYFTQTLDAAFQYSTRLNKPVVPFVWYLVHPSNSKFRLSILSKSEVARHINFIRDYSFKNNEKVDGIVWWDTPTPFIKKTISSKLLKDDQRVKVDNSVIFREYMKAINF